MDLPDSDADLVARVNRGDAAALDEILLRHRGAVYGYLRARGVRSSDAEELTAEVFLRFYRGRCGLDGTRSLRPLLLGMAQESLRRIVQLAPAGRDFAWAELCLDLEEAAPGTLDDETLARFSACLGALDPSGREAIELKYRPGGTFSRVAERLRRSEPATRLLLYRARQALCNGLAGRAATSAPE